MTAADTETDDTAGLPDAAAKIGALLDKGLVEPGGDAATDKQLRDLRNARDAVQPKRKPAKAAEGAEKPPASKTVTTPAAEPEGDDAEDDEAEADDKSAEAGEDEDEADVTEDSQEPVPLRLKDIAEKAGVKVEDFDDLMLTAKVNGREHEVSLKDLRESYQLRSHIDARAHRLREERETFQRSQSEQDTETQRLLGIAARGFQALHAHFVGQRPDEKYRAEYGDDAFVRESELWRRRDEDFNREFNAVLGGIDQMNAKFKAKADEFKAHHQRLLREALPIYFDPKKGPAAWQTLVAYLTHMGLTADEMERMEDSRYVRIAHDAAQWHALKQGKWQIAKKQKSSQKPIRTASADEPDEARRIGTQRLRTNLRKTGSVDVAAMLISRMGHGSAR